MDKTVSIVDPVSSWEDDKNYLESEVGRKYENNLIASTVFNQIFIF
jgi:hypothetical protein